MAQLPILNLPKLSTTERDAQDQIIDGGLFFNTTTFKVQFSDDTLTYEDVASEAYVTSEIGSITPASIGAVASVTGTANQVNVGGTATDPILSLPQNIDDTAVPAFRGLSLVGTVSINPYIELYTPDSTVGEISNIQIKGYDSLSVEAQYANIRTEIVDNTSSDFYGKTVFSSASAGSLLDILEIGGMNTRVKSMYDMASASNYIFDTTVASGQGWDVIHSMLSGEAIAQGALCKSSTTTAFRLESVKSSDPITTPVIAVTTNATLAAGETQTVSGMTILNVLVDENVAIGDPLKKSGTTNGRAIVATPGDPGIFAVALESKLAGSVAIAAHVINQAASDQTLLTTSSPTFVDQTLSSLTASALVTSDGTKKLVTGNLSGDITTSSGLATTLATVNSDVGSFTSANITVNAKGLITAASNGSAAAGRLLNVQTFTTSATYTPTAGTNTAIVILTGGGGGGGGAGVSGTGQSNGGTGGSSLFGAIFAASGGNGGILGTNVVSGSGGTGSASAGGTFMIPGSGGTTGYLCGGAGGSSYFGGGAAAKGGNTQTGYSAVANTGGGGGGGTYVSYAAGGGGGAATGVYYYTSVASQSITIGAGGTAGSAGTSGGAGGAGGSGFCVIYEYS